MKTLAKVVAYIIAILIILFLIAAILLKTLINPNDYKAKITAAVQKKTGLQLHINGKIALSFAPWLGIDVNDVVLDSANGFGQTPLLSVKDAAVKMKWLPLFVGRLEVSNITLNQPTINLLTKTNGQQNWQANTTAAVNQSNPATTQANDSSSTASAVSQQTKPQTTNQRHDLDLNINNIDIKQGNVHINDLKNNKQLSLTNLNFSGDNINLSGDNMTLFAGFQYAQSNPIVKLTANINSKLSYNQRDNSIHIDSLDESGTITQLYKALPTPVNFRSSVDDLTINKQQTTVEHLSASIANLALTASLRAKHTGSRPEIEGKISIPSFNPQQFSRALNLPTANHSIQSASLNIGLHSANNTVTLKPFVVKLDDHTVNINANYQVPPVNHLTFSLNADQINLDQLLPKPNEINTAPPINKSMPVMKATGPSNVAPVKATATEKSSNWYDMGWQGQINIGSFTMNKLTFNNIAITTKNNKGQISLAPVSAHFYDGKLNAQATMVANQAQPAYTLNTSVTGVDLGKLLLAMTNKNIMDGHGNFSMQVNTRGNTDTSIIRNLNGNGQLLVTNGKLFGFNLDGLVNQVASFVNKGKVGKPQLNTGNETDFNQLTGSFQIRNGVVSNNDLRLAASSAMATGQGQINLVNKTVDYQMSVGPKADNVQQQAWNFPLVIAGPLDHPKITPNVASIISQVIKNVIKDEGKKTGKQIQKFFQGLFN